MKLAIMQPYLFPYLGYFDLIRSVDKFVIYDDVNYINRGWINRNRILVNGEPYMFTLPLKNASQNKKIFDISISDNYQDWKRKFMKTLSNNYTKADNFDECYRLIDELLSYETTNISNFLTNSIKSLSEYLDIKTEIVESSSYYKNQELKSYSRIINICEKEGANIYVNAIGGKELYNAEDFDTKGIKLRFMEEREYVYYQHNKSFYSNLSIIDALMFNDKHTIIEKFFKEKKL